MTYTIVLYEYLDYVNQEYILTTDYFTGDLDRETVSKTLRTIHLFIASNGSLKQMTFRQRLALHLGRKQNQRPAILWDGKGGQICYVK